MERIQRLEVIIIPNIITPIEDIDMEEDMATVVVSGLAMVVGLVLDLVSDLEATTNSQ